jgi:hypothetical protein
MVLISKYKVYHAVGGIIIIEFTKAKSLEGQRFAIRVSDAMKYPTETNGKIDCFVIPLTDLENWESRREFEEREEREAVERIFDIQRTSR